MLLSEEDRSSRFLYMATCLHAFSCVALMASCRLILHVKVMKCFKTIRNDNNEQEILISYKNGTPSRAHSHLFPATPTSPPFPSTRLPFHSPPLLFLPSLSAQFALLSSSQTYWALWTCSWWKKKLNILYVLWRMQQAGIYHWTQLVVMWNNPRTCNSSAASL